MSFDNIKKAVVELDENAVKNLVNKMLKENYKPEEILEKGLVPGMKEVGQLFSQKVYFVPEVLLASEVFYTGMELIRPTLLRKGGIKASRLNSPIKPKTKIVIGVVEGDIHDIGKNIVKVMFEASGYEVIDLGRDVSNEKFIEVVINERPKVLALSALMTTTMMQMEKIMTMLEKNKLRKGIKVIVGGAPLNQEFANRIGADGYGEDAFKALRLVEKLTEF